MLIDFVTHPGGQIVTVDGRRVTTVAPDPADPGRTIVRFSGGSHLVVVGTAAEVKARLERSFTVRNPKRG